MLIGSSRALAGSRAKKSSQGGLEMAARNAARFFRATADNDSGTLNRRPKYLANKTTLTFCACQWQQNRRYLGSSSNPEVQNASYNERRNGSRSVLLGVQPEGGRDRLQWSRERMDRRGAHSAAAYTVPSSSPLSRAPHEIEDMEGKKGKKKSQVNSTPTKTTKTTLLSPEKPLLSERYHDLTPLDLDPDVASRKSIYAHTVEEAAAASFPPSSASSPSSSSPSPSPSPSSTLVRTGKNERKQPQSFLSRLLSGTGGYVGGSETDSESAATTAESTHRELAGVYSFNRPYTRRDRETERALERTLRGAGGKGYPSFGSGTGSGSGAGGTGLGGLNMRCTSFNSKGDVTNTAGEFGKSELCTRYGIQPRDLRKLDSAVPTVVPTILVRREAIIFTVLHLRVVITANEVTLFDSVGSEDSWLKGVFVWHLEHALKTSTKASLGLPYEFRALESCLISVTTALETEMVNIRGLVIELLDGLEDHIERDKLRLLLQYSRKLSSFQKRATLVQECLEEVLENDDDLAAMYLTSKHEQKTSVSGQGQPRDPSEHEEIELLLESFSKQCEEIVSEVENLAGNVKNTEDIIELILDANRNSLLGLDLKVSICTLGLTSGALIAGLFGMNLATQLESHPYAFPIVSLSAFTFAGVVTMMGLRRLRRMRRIGLGWRHLASRGDSQRSLGTTRYGKNVHGIGGGEGDASGMRLDSWEEGGGGGGGGGYSKGGTMGGGRWGSLSGAWSNHRRKRNY